jgi:DNA invertase Pin-like site-specific DNA recombinase
MKERPTMKPKRAALYLRVSTDEQTTENQRQALRRVCEDRGWQIVNEYEDDGVSGAKGRDQRLGLDRMLKDATRRRFDVVLAWSVDRLGRSLMDLISGLQELHTARVDLFLHQQALDTTTASGKAMFQMMGVFAEFERAMIQARVQAGMDRAKAEQAAGRVRRDKQGRLLKAIGRPRVSAETEAAIRERLAAGAGILKVAGELGVGSGTVQRVKAAM